MQAFEPAKLSRQILTSCFAAACIGFLLVNMVASKAVANFDGGICREMFDEKQYNQPYYGTWCWWLTKAFVDQEKTPDVILLGSSQMNTAVLATDAQEAQEAVDLLTHRRVNALERRLFTIGASDPRVFNAAIAGAVASDYYMAAKALIAGANKPKIVIIGVSPRDFIDNKLPSASSTEAFRFFSRFVDTGKLTAIAYPDIFARINAQVSLTFEKMPLRQLHGLVDNFLVAQKAEEPKNASKNQLLAAVLNTAQLVKPGEWMIPANIPPMFDDNSDDYIRRYHNPNPASYPIQLAFLNDLLNWLNKENIKVLVVAMPTLPENRQLLPNEFWSDYRLKLSRLCQNNGAYWVDVSHCSDFEKSDYGDYVHLNASGGAKILDVFSEGIAKRQDLMAAIKEQRGSLASRP